MRFILFLFLINLMFCQNQNPVKPVSKYFINSLSLNLTAIEGSNGKCIAGAPVTTTISCLTNDITIPCTTDASGNIKLSKEINDETQFLDFSINKPDHFYVNRSYAFKEKGTVQDKVWSLTDTIQSDKIGDSVTYKMNISVSDTSGTKRLIADVSLELKLDNVVIYSGNIAQDSDTLYPLSVRLPFKTGEITCMTKAHADGYSSDSAGTSFFTNDTSDVFTYVNLTPK